MSERLNGLRMDEWANQSRPRGKEREALEPAAPRPDEAGRPKPPPFERWLSALPWALTTTRLLLAPVLIGLGYAGAGGAAFLACLTVGFLSDVFDGVIARRLGVATPGLRRFDCLADIAFYLGVLGCILLRYPRVAEDNAWFFAGLLLADGLLHAISLIRFGRLPATHSYLGKAWGVLLFAAAAALLGLGVAGALLQITLAVGALAYLDGLVILLVARTPPVDVPSAFHAWRSRLASGNK